MVNVSATKNVATHNTDLTNTFGSGRGQEVSFIQSGLVLK